MEGLDETRHGIWRNMIKAVIFDLDDTLYRERDFVDQAFRSVAEVMAGDLAKNGKAPEKKKAGSCAL